MKERPQSTLPRTFECGVTNVGSGMRSVLNVMLARRKFDVERLTNRPDMSPALGFHLGDYSIVARGCE